MTVFDSFKRQDLGEVKAQCSKHGEYMCMTYRFMNKEHQDPCKKCAEEAAQARADEEVRRAKEREQRKFEELMRRLGISLRHCHKDFSNYSADTEEKTTALNQCRSFVDDVIAAKDVGGMLMIGKPGTGKTHLSCSILKALAEKEIFGRRQNLRDIFLAVKETYSKTDMTERQIINKYGDEYVLIIDEVGAFSMSEREREILTAIIDRRYENLVYTVIVSNLNIEELKLEMGARNMDRLREDGGRLVKFTWESARK